MRGVWARKEGEGEKSTRPVINLNRGEFGEQALREAGVMEEGGVGSVERDSGTLPVGEGRGEVVTEMGRDGAVGDGEGLGGGKMLVEMTKGKRVLPSVEARGQDESEPLEMARPTGAGAT